MRRQHAIFSTQIVIAGYEEMISIAFLLIAVCRNGFQRTKIDLSILRQFALGLHGHKLLYTYDN